MAAARSHVQTQFQRRVLTSLILVTVLATSLLLTGGAFYYKEYSLHYLGMAFQTYNLRLRYMDILT